MAKDADKSKKLKEDGNNHFQAGDYIGAEGLYSKAIIADDANPSLYTNRAMARLRLGYYDSAISDCNECLKLSRGENLKAHFILSQCQLAIKDCDAALESALQAHRLCVETNDRSLGPVTNQVLRCKKDRWDVMERKRTREGQELEGDIVALMERERDDAVKSCTNDFDRNEVKEEWNQKIALLRETFEKSRPAAEKKRQVPDWAIDDISFAIMVDPVVTKNGKSYDRASIMEHLRRHQVDPLTREPLHPNELRPNIQLREACQEFLETNGWAAEW
ncbi:U-box-domain-containing protein [Jackrogersella minutella]|nr:U-box-domain-containing protein [Jackrogersella minutella]